MINAAVFKVDHFDRHARRHIHDAGIHRIDTQVTDPRPSVVVAGLADRGADDVACGHVAALQDVFGAVAILPIIGEGVLLTGDVSGVIQTGGRTVLEVGAYRILYGAGCIAVSYDGGDQDVFVADLDVSTVLIHGGDHRAVRDLVADIGVGAIKVVERPGVQVVLHTDVLGARHQLRVFDCGAADVHVCAVLRSLLQGIGGVPCHSGIIDIVDVFVDRVSHISAALGLDVIEVAHLRRSVDGERAALISHVNGVCTLVIQEVEDCVAAVYRDRNGARPSLVVGAAGVGRGDGKLARVLDLVREAAHVAAAVNEADQRLFVVRQVDRICGRGKGLAASVISVGGKTGKQDVLVVHEDVRAIRRLNVFTLFIGKPAHIGDQEVITVDQQVRAACGLHIADQSDIVLGGRAVGIGPSVAAGEEQVVLKRRLVHHDGPRLILRRNAGDLIVVEHVGVAKVLGIDREDVGACIGKGDRRVEVTAQGDDRSQRAGIVAK